ncbi:pseudouridine synthase [Candidatus Jettenia caeni]|uniref:Pseudouridine synthase n=1 Tax=Candidatus Jettenia caeni TaxID=247490 RepID=I3IRG0_9BACT|nr:RluA family pseudouridine synthase [Candidatus Jettenia sp. AMX1]NUN24195.1 RluA family pseudouridine synthase [Candidatus Jettenia caeni]WKZ15717.1 MAG: RluA family pseudouridine synthase [Candidatus Jettenia caeni]GAB64305.1 pseudouridine synthase [Candidatus Jettenia caeni]
MNFIAYKLAISKKRAKQLLDKRLVFVNKRRIWIASYQLNRGDVVEVLTEDTQPAQSKKGVILYQDDHYLIVSKPPGILTNGAESLENNLKIYLKNNRMRAVHRLDKDTSGVVIFAMNKGAFEHMKTLFKGNLVKKVYRVIVKGNVGIQNFTIDTPLHGQKAVTHVKLLKRGRDTSYLEVNIETGRTHQIRTHLASAGYPVIGEMEYNRKPIKNPLLRHIRRQMLHAYQITFSHPYTHKTISITAEIPDDFNQNLKTFGLAE